MAAIDEVIWTHGATADLLRVHQWMEEQGEGRGESFLERVDVALETLRLFPEMAPR